MGKNNEIENLEDSTITLTFDNDQTVECAIIAVFPVDDNQYMALMALEEAEDISPEEIFLYRYVPTDDEEEVTLEDLEDDEYEKVADAFEAILEEEDNFVELLDDDEE